MGLINFEQMYILLILSWSRKEPFTVDHSYIHYFAPSNDDCSVASCSEKPTNTKFDDRVSKLILLNTLFYLFTLFRLTFRRRAWRSLLFLVIVDAFLSRITNHSPPIVQVKERHKSKESAQGDLCDGIGQC